MGGALSTTFEKEYDNINKKINNIIIDFLKYMF